MGKEIISPPGCPVSPFRPSLAIRTGELLWISGLMATDYSSGIAPEAEVNPNIPNYGPPAIKRQARYIYSRLNEILNEAGCSFDHLIRIEQFFTDRSQAPYFFDAYKEIPIHDRPTTASVIVNHLEVPGALVACDFISIVPSAGVQKEPFHTNKVPQPLAKYALAQQVGDLIVLPGNTASDFKTGIAPEARADKTFWFDSDITKQTEFILKTRQIVLGEMGLSLKDLIMTQVYLTDMRDFSGFEEVWIKHFPKEPPARTVIPVDGLAVAASIVEISMIAVRPDGGYRKETIETSRAPHPLTHEPQAIKAGPYLFFSGQMAVDDRGFARQAQVNPRLPYHESSIKKQTEYILKNVQAIAEAADGSLDCLVKRQAFHSDLREMLPSFEVWREAIPHDPPVSTTVGVDSPLPVPGCTLLLSLIGYLS